MVFIFELNATSLCFLEKISFFFTLALITFPTKSANRFLTMEAQACLVRAVHLNKVIPHKHEQ